MIIFDTDILSMFAKTDEVELLNLLFKEDIAVTPKIRDEILVPFEYGYSFPLRVISKVKTLPLSREALEEYERLRQNFALGKGELEAIAYCKTEGCMFATNDAKARELAIKEGVTVISLQAILKALWRGNIKSKEEVKQILARIKEADNLYVSSKVESAIFDES